jgi:hypothetical protein
MILQNARLNYRDDIIIATHFELLPDECQI